MPRNVALFSNAIKAIVAAISDLSIDGQRR
jgi:hypothetical protein